MVKNVMKLTITATEEVGNVGYAADSSHYLPDSVFTDGVWGRDRLLGDPPGLDKVHKTPL